MHTKILAFILMFNGFSSFSQADSAQLYNLLDTIVGMGHRVYSDTAVLDRVGCFIEAEFKERSPVTYKQTYQIGGFRYSNIIALVGDTTKPRIVIGAHYDVCGEQDGADDNGSGVVGIILALDQLKDYAGEYCLEFVAYTLEEPPLYNTEYMGSLQHANWLKSRGTEVFGMVSLEMIGYYSDAKKSQSYPLGILKMIYGGKGDYITLVRKFEKGKFTRRFTKAFRKSKYIKTKKFTGPRKLTGIDFSDHRSYWSNGFDALMITDTSFYRNANYHKKSDTIETLDFNRMADVVNAVVFAINKL